MDIEQPSPTAHTIAGLILAGGRARRMQGQDKGLIPFAGRPLIEHVLDRIRPQVDQILISANRNLEQYAEYGHTVITDVIGDYCGPLAGIHSALPTLQQSWLAVVPCDSPLLPTDLVYRLFHSAQSMNAPLAVAHDGQRMQPVMALLHQSLLGSLHTYLEGGGRRMDTWFIQQQAVITDLSDRPEAFRNINSPQDLLQLELWLASRSNQDPSPRTSPA